MELVHQVSSHLASNWNQKQSKTSLVAPHGEPRVISGRKKSIWWMQKSIRISGLWQTKETLTKQPVGSQHLRGFGWTLDQILLSAVTALLCGVLVLSKSVISTQRVTSESCNGLYNSPRVSLLRVEKGWCVNKTKPQNYYNLMITQQLTFIKTFFNCY